MNIPDISKEKRASKSSAPFMATALRALPTSGSAH
jgi:hypothetical protein